MPFNKMFVMVPLMLAARKLDGEDPNIVFMLRCAYFSIQGIILGMVLYIYLKASALAGGPEGSKVVYVPPPPQPMMGDSKENKKYTETTYGQHVLTAARTLAGSTIFGMCVTIVLHFYKGIVMGLAMGSVMGPLSLIENPLAKLYLLGKKDRIFEEKSQEELTPEDEVVDGDGKTVTPRKAVKEEKPKTFEDVLLDTWDIGADADITQLMGMVTKENANLKTKESGWTPIMIMSGLGGEKTAEAINKMKEKGADPAMVDGEGWNALHWSAFHGRPAAAKVLLAAGGDLEKELCSLKDKEGKSALDHAEAEGNLDVAKEILKFLKENGEEVKESVPEEGLRRRKKDEAKET